MGTTATAANQGDVPAAAGGGCEDNPGRGVVVARVIRSLLRPVVTRLELRHLAGGLLRPLRVARAVGDDGPDRQSGPQLRPAVVLFDGDAYRHALLDPGELAGDDVPGHQGELRPGRFIDPHYAATKRLCEGVQV